MPVIIDDIKGGAFLLTRTHFLLIESEDPATVWTLQTSSHKGKRFNHSFGGGNHESQIVPVESPPGSD